MAKPTPVDQDYSPSPSTSLKSTCLLHLITILYFSFLLPLDMSSSLDNHINPARPVSLNDHIAVYWPIDDTFYPGVVVDLNGSNGTVVVRYNDGDVETLLLDDEIWRYDSRVHLPTAVPPSRQVALATQPPVQVSAATPARLTTAGTPTHQVSQARAQHTPMFPAIRRTSVSERRRYGPPNTMWNSSSPLFTANDNAIPRISTYQPGAPSTLVTERNVHVTVPIIRSAPRFAPSTPAAPNSIEEFEVRVTIRIEHARYPPF